MAQQETPPADQPPAFRPTVSVEDVKPPPDPDLEREQYDVAKAINSFTLADGLQDYARKLKRNLLTWTAIAALVNYQHIRLTEIPLIRVPAENAVNDVMPLVLFIPLAYTLVSFIVQALADLSLWRTRRDEQLFRGQFNIALKLSNQLHNMREDTYKRASMLFYDAQRIQANIGRASHAAKEAAAALEEAFANARTGTRLRVFMAYAWEFALPAIVSATIVVYCFPHALKAVRQLIVTLSHA